MPTAAARLDATVAKRAGEISDSDCAKATAAVQAIHADAAVIIELAKAGHETKPALSSIMKVGALVSSKIDVCKGDP